MRDVVRSIVSDIAPLDSEEADHRVDAIRWIDAGSDMFRTVKPATPPKHLVADCMLAETDARRILLVDHRGAQRWPDRWPCRSERASGRRRKSRNPGGAWHQPVVSSDNRRRASDGHRDRDGWPIVKPHRCRPVVRLRRINGSPVVPRCPVNSSTLGGGASTRLFTRREHGSTPPAPFRTGGRQRHD